MLPWIFPLPFKVLFYVVCSYNQWFFNVLFSKCFVARIRVLGEAKKHNLVFQIPIHRIWRWPMGGELQDVEVHTFSNCWEIKVKIIERNTKYIKAILVEIHVSCVIYKFAHSYNFLICNELFAIRKFTVSLVLHEFVVVMNIVFKKLISLLVGANAWPTMNHFKLWCGMFSVLGTINGTHFFISKPSMFFPNDY